MSIEKEIALLDEIAGALRRGRSVALATVVSTDKSSPRKAGAKMLVYPDGSIAGTVGGGVLEALVIREAKKAIEKGEPVKLSYSLDPENPENISMCCGGEMEIFVDVYSPRPPLVIFGAGHVGERIARLAEVLRMPYAVADDRKEFASRARFPEAAMVYHGPYAGAFSKLPIGRGTNIVICTRGHAHDLLCLREALKTDAAYVGLVASREKARRFREQLESDGEVKWDERIFSPMGLDIGGSSPEHIALSVMAEIVKLETRGTAKHKRLEA